MNTDRIFNKFSNQITGNAFLDHAIVRIFSVAIESEGDVMIPRNFWRQTRNFIKITSEINDTLSTTFALNNTFGFIDKFRSPLDLIRITINKNTRTHCIESARNESFQTIKYWPLGYSLICLQFIQIKSCGDIISIYSLKTDLLKLKHFDKYLSIPYKYVRHQINTVAEEMMFVLF